MDKFLVTPKTRKKLLASLAVILLVTLHISFLRSLMMNHAADNVLVEGYWDIDPAELRKAYHLDTPIYASMCKWGLFGEYQSDKAWE